MKEYNIKPKLEIGSFAYTMNSKHICQYKKITSISLYIKEDGTMSVWYTFEDLNTANEDEVFASVSELKAYVFQNFMSKEEDKK